MKVSFLALLAVLSAAPIASAQTWTELGGSATGSGLGTPGIKQYSPVTAIRSDGNPVAAWFEEILGPTPTRYKIRLAHWNGSAWVALGGSLTGDGVTEGALASGSASMNDVRWMTLDSNDNPVVTWTSAVMEGASTTIKIYVRRWTGTTWAPLGGSDSGGGLNGFGNAYAPVVAVDGAGRPVVAWLQNVGFLSYRVYVKRWDGDSWEALGESASYEGLNPGGTAFWLSMAVAGDRPVVCWSNATIFFTPPPNRVFLKRWTGSAWEELAGSGSGSGLTPEEASNFFPSVAVTPSGDPVVAWSKGPQFLAASDIMVRRWTGSAWTGLGGSDVDRGISADLPETSRNGNASLVIDSAGRPIVAWSNSAPSTGNEPEILLKRWTGTAWAGVGGSEVPGAISSTETGQDLYPMLARGAAGAFSVTWQQSPSSATGTPPPPRVFLKARIIPPPLARSLSQVRLDGTTPIPAGGLTFGETGFWARALVVAEDGSHRIEVEAAPVGEPFNGSHTAVSEPAPAGGTAAAQFSGLPAGAQLRWRARILGTGPESWSYFGSEPDAPWETDVWTRGNSNPTLSLLQQVDPQSQAPVSVGARILNSGTILVSAFIGDDDGDQVRIEIQMARPGEAYEAGPASDAAEFYPAGAVSADLPVEGLGARRWRARGADEYGGHSDWIEYGGNGEGEADFVLVGFGSTNSAPCSGSPASSAPVLALLALLAAAKRR